jgi:hypothetical protein
MEAGSEGRKRSSFLLDSTNQYLDMQKMKIFFYFSNQGKSGAQSNIMMNFDWLVIFKNQKFLWLNLFYKDNGKQDPVAPLLITEKYISI